MMHSLAAIEEPEAFAMDEAVKALHSRSPSADSSADTDESSDDDEELEFECEFTLEPVESPVASQLQLQPKPALPPVEIAFSSSGGSFVYQMGVAAYIQEHFDLSECHFSGCSGGSWAATLLAAGTPVRRAWDVIKATQSRLVENPRWYSGYGRYSAIIEQTIQALWRDDPTVFERVGQRHLSIAVTKFPSMTAEKLTHWESLEDLTKSILASCLIPMALTGKPCISHRGNWYIDGCVTNFKGVKSDAYSTWRDLSFHAAQLALSTVRSTTSSVAGWFMPSSWAKRVTGVIERVVPALESPDEAVAPVDVQPRSIIITPWTWRSQKVTAYHLSVDVTTHQRRFDEGYGDALAHHGELAALLPKL